MAYNIRNEDDLFDTIEELKDGSFDSSKKLHFNGWPECKITICGKDFDDGIPTRILPAFTALQDEINHGYARCMYGKVQPLTEEEAERVELIIRCKPGSLRVFLKKWKILNNMYDVLQGDELIWQYAFLLMLAMVLSENVMERCRDSRDRRHPKEQKNVRHGDEQRTKRLREKEKTKRLREKEKTKRHRETEKTKRHRYKRRIASLRFLTKFLAEKKPQNQFFVRQKRDTKATGMEFLRALNKGDKLFVNGSFVIDGKDAQSILQQQHRKPRGND